MDTTTAIIDDQVIDFFDQLFEEIFTSRFDIPERRKRKDVTRQVEAAADAASQSLSRFFTNQAMKKGEVSLALHCLAGLSEVLNPEDIANPNITPERLAQDALPRLPCPEELVRAGKEAEYRLALHSVVQVLMLVGPVMSEWRKLAFASTFEVPGRVVNRLNQISEQIGAIGTAHREQADENYELTYRDYLMQRFHRVEVGTVRMTTKLGVDLRELFVMPRLLPRKDEALSEKGEGEESFMDLAAARRLLERPPGFRVDQEEPEKKDAKRPGRTALEQIAKSQRTVIIGLPGSGKSTLLEWLQLKVASAEEPLVMGDSQQAIPLVLRVRQLAPDALPRGAELIAKATASSDTAALMPPRWIDRQMAAGRLLFMLDGLDETTPEDRDDRLLPWLQELVTRYPKCRYLVSSRPVGYPQGWLKKVGFLEADLLDFEEPEVREYLCHWSTAVRLAQEEPEAEARREGQADADRILAGFRGHPYISDLARTPLMLSAICLVNYFEHGRLPEDRARLYRLCVEGLLHHWDQRRGILSEFGLEEKLRACRSVALALQVGDRAEWGVDRIEPLFAEALGDSDRGRRLLEHIRYRTGLLLERRPGVYAFAHLTFQEYLALRPSTKVTPWESPLSV